MHPWHQKNLKPPIWRHGECPDEEAKLVDDQVIHGAGSRPVAHQVGEQAAPGSDHGGMGGQGGINLHMNRSPGKQFDFGNDRPCFR